MNRMVGVDVVEVGVVDAAGKLEWTLADEDGWELKQEYLNYKHFHHWTL